MNWGEALRLYGQPRVLAMLLLGFSAGLPLLLVFGTLSAWLREAGVDRSTIGHVSWVATLYALKFVWAPLVDRVPVPVLGRLLGQRRGWMLAAQLGVAGGLLAMAGAQPGQGLQVLVVCALLVAFCSATQDISIDAWRIEAVGVEAQGAMAAMYQGGYRIGMIVAGAGALYVAEYASWGMAYTAMAACMTIGMATTLLVPEPEHRRDAGAWEQERRVLAFLERSAHLPRWARRVGAWFLGAVVCPFAEFFSRNGRLALAILAFIGVFRLCDITMGVMANPFYIDMGYSKADIASVTKVFGLGMTMAGAALGGVLVARVGVMRILLVSAALAAGTNILFAWLATRGAPDISLLALVISADNLSGGMAGSAFIAYLSGLTNRAYTATQYALFSSLMLLPSKFLGGFSGQIVDAVGYSHFFVYSAALGIPALVLIGYLSKVAPVEAEPSQRPMARRV